jgi:hypothetical protein
VVFYLKSAISHLKKGALMNTRNYQWTNTQKTTGHKTIVWHAPDTAVGPWDSKLNPTNLPSMKDSSSNRAQEVCQNASQKHTNKSFVEIRFGTSSQTKITS